MCDHTEFAVMDVARRWRIHVPDNIFVQDLKGLFVTEMDVIEFMWLRKRPVRCSCEHDKESWS